MHWLLRHLRLTVALLGGVLSVGISAHADEIKVLAPGLLKDALVQAAAQFASGSGHKVALSVGPSSGNSPAAIPMRINSGESIDVLITVSAGMDQLIREGRFVAQDRADIATSGIGVGVRAGQPLPSIATVALFRQALLNAASIGYSEGPSGAYFSNVLLKRLGIADEVASRGKLIGGDRLVGDAIANGEVELGIQQASELRLIKGVIYVGPLPGELQRTTVISAAVSAHAKNTAAAKGFLTYLTSTAGGDAIKNIGLDLPTRTP